MVKINKTISLPWQRKASGRRGEERKRQSSMMTNPLYSGTARATSSPTPSRHKCPYPPLPLGSDQPDDVPAAYGRQDPRVSTELYSSILRCVVEAPHHPSHHHQTDSTHLYRRRRRSIQRNMHHQCLTMQASPKKTKTLKKETWRTYPHGAQGQVAWSKRERTW